MNMNCQNQQGFAVVTLRGAMDVETIAIVKEDLERISEQEHKGVVVDMAGVNFLDSSGIGALVFLYKRLTAVKRPLHLVGLNGQPQKLVRLLRIDKTIACHTQLEDISDFSNASPVMGG